LLTLPILIAFIRLRLNDFSLLFVFRVGNKWCITFFDFFFVFLIGFFGLESALISKLPSIVSFLLLILTILILLPILQETNAISLRELADDKLELLSQFNFYFRELVLSGFRNRTCVHAFGVLCGADTHPTYSKLLSARLISRFLINSLLGREIATARFDPALQL